MDAESIFGFLLGELGHVDAQIVCPLLAEFLEEHDYFVAEDEGELEDLAAEHCNMVKAE